ncbi:hypothetical protein KEM52_006430 [Ascosphaera acerosa]|nr:hypothetical protein KEM52_006430 [Ascosphaera acerosa]
MRWLVCGWLALSTASTAIAGATAAPRTQTQLHEAGRCAIRGHCGKKGFFGKDLPCEDNGLAEAPDQTTRDKLVKLCGERWARGDVCCREDQVDALASNLKLVDGVIASCPACRANFYNLFCTFTCSPDQSLFVDVLATSPKNGRQLVDELDNLWSEDYLSGFYDSCQAVKNGASGGRAMDFIGGGARNYTQFLKFLGDKKMLGSPFQMNFVTQPNDAQEHAGMAPLTQVPKQCNDSDPAYRCSCVDCPAVCPQLPALKTERTCRVGVLPCLSFAIIMIYTGVLVLLALGVAGRVGFQTHRRRRLERMRLLHDSAGSESDESDDELFRRRAGGSRLGDGPINDDDDDDDDDAGVLDRPQRTYKLNQKLDVLFTEVGRFCATFPAFTIGVSVAFTALLSCGWIRAAVETDPVKLWVSPSSAAAQEKAFFDTNFGPFYRAEQVFVVNDTRGSHTPDATGGPRPVLSYDTLQWWFDVERRVQRMISPKTHTAIEDVCFNPTGDACVVQSLTGYFGGPFQELDPLTWSQHLQHCTDQPGSLDCLPEFKQPLKSDMVLGGYDQEASDVLNANAFVVTWVVNNYNDDRDRLAAAEDWEEGLQDILTLAQLEASDRGLRLSFNTEISLEQELNKSTNTDAKIVVVSYIIMFLYAALALGSTTLSWRSVLANPANSLVQSKFTLSVIGIMIVLMSVVASVGLFSMFDIRITLIIAEVIPFLVLAVGVDNVFLIVHEFERVNADHPDEAIDQRVARALGRMGPSILLSSLTETVAFAMGAFVGMPAVKNFAAYAAGAVFINALLQMTMFISVLALNQQRVESRRADCLPCLTVRKASPSNTPNGQALVGAEDGVLQHFIRKVYAAKLLQRRVKAGVVILFLGMFTAGLALLPAMELGLDQRIAIPSDSYLIDYFNDLYDYFDTGPPVYFVTRDVNITQRAHQQQLCGRFSTCDDYSLNFVLEQEAKRSNVSYITGATASWLDDFLYWLNPQQDCCMDEDGVPCFENRVPPWNISLYGMPEGQEFANYAARWLAAPTDAQCPLGGKAPYSNALVVDTDRPMTHASHFRTSHTPLRSQRDFIDAYASARRIANDLSRRHHIDIFPYSKFYIFFDQYATIIRLTAALVGSAIAVIFVITATILGSAATGAVVAATVTMTVVDIMGAMVISGVSLNAVSLVNLIICVGIGFEFCAHIARAFTYPSRSLLEKARLRYQSRDARAWTALVNVGGSVFSGITVTKLLGVCVLAFTRSKIFEIYYFRVWLALVLLAALHALVFLPVALSLLGGTAYADPHSAGGLEEDLASRRYRALMPDDEYDSDDE